MAVGDWCANRIAIDGPFLAVVHAWTELVLAVGWPLSVAVAVAYALRRLLGRARPTRLPASTRRQGSLRMSIAADG